MFAWIDAVARRRPTGATLNGQATVRAWRALAAARAEQERRGRPGDGGAGPEAGSGAAAQACARRRLSRSRSPRSTAPGSARCGADISAAELRRAGLRAMGEVAARLGLGDAHVVFGHTHRAGPLPGDEPREWRGRGGARLVNAGCWTYAVFVAREPGESPYWPGGCVLVEDDGPPGCCGC